MSRLKIFITGCAKSGTTLTRRLFNAFENLTVYNFDEISLGKFVANDFNVAKRVRATIFSDYLEQKTIDLQLNLIRENEIKIINIVRKKENILKKRSDKRYDLDELEKRYDVCLEQAEK